MKQTELNTALVESYGELEQLCNQIYGTHHSVTNYIDDMYSLNLPGQNMVDNWNYYLKRLKEVRYKRNKLSHGEVGFGEKWAEKEDIEFIINLKNSIIKQTDPLSVLRKKGSVPRAKVSKPKPAKREHLQSSSGAFAIAIFLLLAIIFAVILFFNSKG